MPARRTTQSPEPPSWSEWRAQHQQKPWYRRYPLAVEWFLEQTNDRLHRWAFVEFLEHVGKFTVLIAVIVWVLEADNREKERHYRAWELINSARGSTGDGGRIDALQDLNKDGVSLAAAPLEGAWLVEIDLQGANLQRANLQRANLWRANLYEADLQKANLREADLRAADLQRAELWRANLYEADLGMGKRTVKIQASYLFLEQTNLQGADLWEADLRNANLAGANLAGANLQDANLQGAFLGNTEGLTQEQLDAAYGNNATQLPEQLTRPAHWVSSKSEQPIE